MSPPLHRAIADWIGGQPNAQASKLQILGQFVGESWSRYQVVNAIQNAQKAGLIEQPAGRRWGGELVYQRTDFAARAAQRREK